MLEGIEGFGVRAGMVVVLAAGCFDPFHYGHLKHLQAAKRFGTHLVVAVTSDRHVNKPGRPAFNQQQRAQVIQELKCVDCVFISEGAVDAINLIKPQIYVKGREYEGRLPEQSLVESYGGKVIFTDEPTYSSTALLTGKYLRLEDIGSG